MEYRMRRAPHWPVTAAALTIMLALSGCGSTVQRTEAQVEGADGAVQGQPGDESSLMAPVTDVRHAGPQQIDPNSNRRPSGLRTSAPGVDSQSNEKASLAPATLLAPGAAGRGFTANKIYVGYAVIEGAEEAADSFGVSVTYGRRDAQANAVIKEINDAGGVAGRVLVPVFFRAQTSELVNNPNGVAQAACEKWTRDQPVFAVVNILNLADEVLSHCLAERRTPQIAMQMVSRPQSVYARYSPFLIAPTQVSLERGIALWTKRLMMFGYFDGGWDALPENPGNEPTRVGVLGLKMMYGHQFIQITQEALARQGVPVEETYLPENAGEINQAVLRFRRAGITHVIAPLNGGLVFFPPSADSQNYYPRYGVSTWGAPEFNQNNQSVEQLTGSLGIGFQPATDVANAQDPGDLPAADKCRRIMENAGQDTSSRSVIWGMFQTCDGFRLLVAAVKAGGLSPESVWQGSQEVESIPSASTFRISLLGDRLDGASAARDLGFRQSCRCYEYLDNSNRAM